MKIKIGLAVAAVATLALVGCAPDHGTVRDRRDTPAHYHDWWSSQCIAYSKNGVCTVSMPIHHHDFVAEKWELKLDDGKDTGWHSVSHDSYDRCEINATYPACKNNG